MSGHDALSRTPGADEVGPVTELSGAEEDAGWEDAATVHLAAGTTVTASITGVLVELMDRLYLQRPGSDELIPLRRLGDVRPVDPAPVSTPISRALRRTYDPRAHHIACRDVGLSRSQRQNLCVCSLHMVDPIHIGATPWRALTADDRGRVEFRRDLIGIERYRPESTEPVR